MPINLIFRFYYKLNKYDINPVKKQKILVLCDEILPSAHVKIRKVSQLLGKFSSSFITVPQGKLYYRSMEINKTSALKLTKGILTH